VPPTTHQRNNNHSSSANNASKKLPKTTSPSAQTNTQTSTTPRSNTSTTNVESILTKTLSSSQRISMSTLTKTPHTDSMSLSHINSSEPLWVVLLQTPTLSFSLSVTDAVYRIITDKYSNLSPSNLYRMMHDALFHTRPDLSFQIYFTDEHVECGDNISINEYFSSAESEHSQRAVLRLLSKTPYGIDLKFWFVLSIVNHANLTHHERALINHQPNNENNQWVIDGLRQEVNSLLKKRAADDKRINKMEKRLTKLQKEVLRWRQEFQMIRVLLAQQQQQQNSPPPSSVLSSSSSIDSPHSAKSRQSVDPFTTLEQSSTTHSEPISPTRALSIESPILAQYTVGASYFSSDKCVQYLHGNSNLVLVCSHGGSISPSSIQTRTSGKLKSDKQTISLTLSLYKRLLHQCGRHPHVIIMHAKRKKVDCNRPIKEGCSCEEAEQLWTQFHSYIQYAIQCVTQREQKSSGCLSKGILLDIHGFASSEANSVQLGFCVSSNHLMNNDRKLDSRKRSSSLSNLSQKSSLSDMLRGEKGLGTLVMNGGGSYSCVPSKRVPIPSSCNTYFSGGYITRIYSQGQGHECMSCVQLETSFEGIRESEQSRERFAGVFVHALNQWMSAHAPQMRLRG